MPYCGLIGPALDRKARRFSLTAESAKMGPLTVIGAAQVKVYKDAVFTFVSADALLSSVLAAERYRAIRRSFRTT